MKFLTLYIIALVVTVVGSGAILFYAQTNPNEYTVRTQILGGSGMIEAVSSDTGINKGNGFIIPVNGGERLKLTAIPDPGWSFSSWGGDLKDKTNPITVIVDRNLSITAILVKK